MKKTKEQELIKRDLQEACYIGEDGAMAVDGRFTLLGAYRKMAQIIKRDTGDKIADYCSIDDLSRGYIHLVTPENQDRFEYDTEQNEL